METNICKNCNHQTNDDFCPKCGHPVKLRKIDRDFVFQEIKDTLFTDHGFPYTTKRIFLSPGDSVRHYITEDRSRFVKPVTYLIITSLIYTIINHIFNINLLIHFGTNDDPDIHHYIDWMIDNRGYVTIIIDLWWAFWIKQFFRKSVFNLFEIFVFMCYVSGIKVLFLSVATILQEFINMNIMPISVCILLIYSFWAIGQFFGRKKVKNYLKAIFSYIFGMIAIFVLVVVVSTIIALIINYC